MSQHQSRENKRPIVRFLTMEISCDYVLEAVHLKNPASTKYRVFPYMVNVIVSACVAYHPKEREKKIQDGGEILLWFYWQMNELIYSLLLSA